MHLKQVFLASVAATCATTALAAPVATPVGERSLLECIIKSKKACEPSNDCYWNTRWNFCLPNGTENPPATSKTSSSTKASSTSTKSTSTSKNATSTSTQPTSTSTKPSSTKTTSTSSQTWTSSKITSASFNRPTPTGATSIYDFYKSVNPTAIPTITPSAVVIQTDAVTNCIAPVPTKEVFYGQMGADNSSVFISQVTFKALDDSQLVNLDDLLPGLTGNPVCGNSTIGLTFISEAALDIAKTQWQKEFTLVTAGGIYCGTAAGRSFFKVSSATFSGLTAALTVTETPLKSAISALDMNFGTVQANSTAPTLARRGLEARGLSLSSVWNDVLDALTSNSKIGTHTPGFEFSETGTVPLVQFTEDDVSVGIICDNCGISSIVDLYGQISLDILGWDATGVIVGLEFKNAEFDMVLDLSLNIEYSQSFEEVFFSFVPYSIDVPDVLKVGPVVELVGEIAIDAETGVQLNNFGFSGTWDDLQVGYNVLTGGFALDGIVPSSFKFQEPNFDDDFAYVPANIDFTAWIGPRITLGLDIANGMAQLDAQIELQFPSVDLNAQQIPVAQCASDNQDAEFAVQIQGTSAINVVASVAAGPYEKDATLYTYPLPQFVNKCYTFGP